MEFIPLYFADRLTVINPQGVIGVVTLWSKPEFVIERFRQAGADLNPDTSPIAVFGTLYGNGLREMLRNLLYNPHIQVLLISGHDRSGSGDELFMFLAGDLNPVDSPLIKYKVPPGFEQVSAVRLADSHRIIDDLVKPNYFKYYPDLPAIYDLGDPKDDAGIEAIKDYFEKEFPRFQAGPVSPEDIKKFPLPELELQYYPGNPRGHQIISEDPLEAWKELLFLITRFGPRVALKKGDRLELQNVKVVVEKPDFGSQESHLAHNLDHDRLWNYYKNFLEKKLRPDEAYTYGHRLRKYFDMDAVQKLAARLKADPEDRKAYFSLWDSRGDLAGKGSRPCFVSAFFRKFEDRLTLTATFRTHNALDAWLLNFYGLMALQKEVAKRAGLPPGAITVFSHSISIDPKELDRVLAVVGRRHWKMQLDPQGYFRVTVDNGEILVEHRFEDVTLKEYRGKTAVALQHQIARDRAVSDINHALYLGRQLARAEGALKEGRPFVQD